jgi:hypothetical protein
VSGLFLILIGVLIAVGRFQQLNGFLSATAYQLRGWSEANPDRARLLLGGATVLLGLVHPVVRLVRRRPLLRPVGSTVAVALIAVGVAQIAGLIDLAAVIAAWLAYQGV